MVGRVGWRVWSRGRRLLREGGSAVMERRDWGLGLMVVGCTA